MTDHSKSRPAKYDRVYRPLGITLAILATAVFYGLMPLLEVYFWWRIDAKADEVFLLGGLEVNTWSWLQGVYGGIVLIICVLAWWGRPSWIRFVLIGAVLLITGVTLYRIIEAQTATLDPITGGQAQETARELLRCQFPFLVIVSLYVTWYLNRAPARAFYRRVPLSSLVPNWVTTELPDRVDQDTIDAPEKSVPHDTTSP